MTVLGRPRKGASSTSFASLLHPPQKPTLVNISSFAFFATQPVVLASYYHLQLHHSTTPRVPTPSTDMASLIALPSSSSSSTRPFPFLPVEIKRHILAFADTGSLALCCSTSLAFLEIASELLYQDIEIDGIERVGQLFCLRVRCEFSLRSFLRVLPLIKAPHEVEAECCLCLIYAQEESSSDQVQAFRLRLSHIRTFTFISRTNLSPEFPELHLPPLVDPLPVKVLTVKAFASTDATGKYYYHHLDTFLPLFNPTSFVVVTLPPRLPDGFVKLDLSDRQLPDWTRLQSVRLVHAMFKQHLNIASRPFNSPAWTITCELPRPFVVERKYDEADDASDLMFDVWYALMNSALHGRTGNEDRFPNEVVKRAEIVVESEEVKSRLDDHFRRRDTTAAREKAIEERMKLISIVVGVISE